jgi:PAS domain S-box-containing protein
MHTLTPTRQLAPRPRWEFSGSLVIASAFVVLIFAVFGPRSYTIPVSTLLLTLVFVALCVAILLHVRFIVVARREQRETVGILDATEREFQSVFDNALDGILILDDTGHCVEANPAALQLLAATRNQLVGQSIQQFLPQPLSDFESNWKALLERKTAQGEARLARLDGAEICVEYTAKANYLPGRHVAVLRDVTLRKQVEAALRESDERFHQMADNIQEIFWMLDAHSKDALYVTPAYEAITGRSCASLQASPKSYQEMFHPEDRVRILTRLEEAARSGTFDEEFRIIRPDHAIRWLSVRGFPVRDSSGDILRLVGIAQDISSRKSAEEQLARNLALAESAWAEADAFRKTTLALTQTLRIDRVLDILLESLLQLIPCESARVLLVETGTHLFLQREAQNCESNRRSAKCPDTLDAQTNYFLMRVLTTKNSLLIPDTSVEPDWPHFKGHSHMRSWLCVPLIASNQILGLLSIGDTKPHSFTQEHQRLAKSLAIPAAVAIQNARLFERAEIYGVELEQRLADLEQTEQALQKAEEGRTRSEERFTRVFRSSPIAFSITTVADGRFVDVNDAFERRYGYAREQLIGQTVFEIGIWDEPDERSLLVQETRKRGQIRNRITRFRSCAGELLDTIYSADIIELDGQECLLAVSEDLPKNADSSMVSRFKAPASHG